MATYLNEKQAYANDVAMMPEEPPLYERLSEIRATLQRTLGVFGELQHGAQPEQGNKELIAPVAGVLTLGAECNKLAHVVENEAMIIAKRIGRL